MMNVMNAAEVVYRGVLISPVLTRVKKPELHLAQLLEHVTVQEGSAVGEGYSCLFRGHFFLKGKFECQTVKGSATSHFFNFVSASELHASALARLPSTSPVDHNSHSVLVKVADIALAEIEYPKDHCTPAPPTSGLKVEPERASFRVSVYLH